MPRFWILYSLVLILLLAALCQRITDSQPYTGNCTRFPSCAESVVQIRTACGLSLLTQDCNPPCQDAIHGYLENLNCGVDPTFALFFEPERADPQVVSAFMICGYAIQPNGTWNDDPVASLNVVYEQFGQHYPFMCQVSMDWPQSYWNTRPSVSEYTEPSVLFDIMAQVLRPFRDPSITLLEFDISVDPPTLNRVFRSGTLPGWSGAPPRTWLNLIDNRYLVMSTEAIPGVMSYGMFTSYPNVGYIRVASFQNYDSMEQWERAWDNAATRLAGGNAIVVDVRFSQGGDELAAAVAAGRFTNTVVPGIQRKMKLPVYYTGCCRFTYRPTQTLCVTPGAVNFVNKDVVVLTSQGTMGAAEVFVMMMRGLPGCRITIVGERTAGAPSDVLFYRLPVGWLGALPHKIYYDRDGRSYDGRGVVPDVVTSLTPAGFVNGTDQILDKALSYIANTRSVCSTCHA